MTSARGPVKKATVSDRSGQTGSTGERVNVFSPIEIDFMFRQVVFYGLTYQLGLLYEIGYI